MLAEYPGIASRRADDFCTEFPGLECEKDVVEEKSSGVVLQMDILKDRRWF